MRTGIERKSSSPSPSPECDVGLGLKTQKLHHTESYLCDVGGGGPLFSYSSSRVSDCAAGDFNRTSDNTVVLPGFFQNPPFGASGRIVTGKALFTESQWRELERQNTIHRYILASIPIPPHLLLFPNPPPPPGFDFRFGSSGSSDPEPWRCKRTDGKKWRCSRDVAPEHKYCERHAHKSKPRSRKHVEISLSSSSASSPSPSPSLPAAHPFQMSTPSMATSYDRTRSIEWFVRGGNSKQREQQQLMMMQAPSPRTEPDRDDNRSPTSYYDNSERQGFYVPDTSTLQMDSSPQTTTTRHFFVDAWEKDSGFDMGISSKIKKLSPSSSSLSLSMSGNWNDNSGLGYEQDDGIENRLSGIGTMSSSSWMNSISPPPPPGGPLGEALFQGGNVGKNTNSRKSSREDGNQVLDFIGR